MASSRVPERDDGGGSTGELSVGIVDDLAVVRICLSRWLTAVDDDLVVTVAAASWAELVESPSFPVDVILLARDVGDGVPLAGKLRAARDHGIPVVLLSEETDGQLPRASLREDPVTILQLIREAEPRDDAAEGTRRRVRPRLSLREREALILYATGLSMKQVANRLNIRFDTAKGYVDSVRQKYAAVDREARTKIELRRRAQEDGLIDLW